MKRILRFLGDPFTKAEAYWALAILLAQAGVFSWLGSQIDSLAAYGWAAFVLFGISATVIVTLTLAAFLAALAFYRRASQPEAVVEPARPALPTIKPTPVFGSPRQLAGEPYISWWHVPITVEGPGGSPNAEINHCQVELFDPKKDAPPIRLRWKSEDDANGQSEITLVEGVERLVPIAFRWERQEEVPYTPDPREDGVARITGAAYLRDGDLNKFSLSPGRIRVKLRVKSGKKSWESEHYYCLRIPKNEESNGGFVLEIDPLLY